MGRYYDGDIEGKFWVSVQDSDDASYFGVEGESPPEYLNYHFHKEDLEKVLDGVYNCECVLGENLEKLNRFFNEDGNNGYNNEMLMEKYNWTSKETTANIEWYARLRLGEQIRDCINKTGQCDFRAEL